jgi:hypothetical protein
MRFRKLRIAWSVGWGILAVLLTVLWVRSYWRVDFMRLGEDRVCMSIDGSVHTLCVIFGPSFGGTLFSRDHVFRFNLGTPKYSLLGVGYDPFEYGTWAVVPHWFLVLLFATIGTYAFTPWLHWHFSLRTLLIATTLLAVVLGVAVWTAR